ncbi:PREDICTED: probable gluconokinase isoform X2 [Tarenaya hassleriana]|nr:PREDICTED: probable gluconokinase isoform X2 [Tarenaya hassleriana]
MSGDLNGKVIVIMGVSGVGKSTVGEMLARAIHSDFLDADDFHPPSNKDKMGRGIPLSDEDRIPWLETIRESLRKRLLDGETVALGCSSLKKQYREILRAADPDYNPGSNSSSKVRFVLLEANEEVIAARLEKRAAEGKHFMPPTLLRSQLDLLEVDENEGIFKINAVLSPDVIVNRIVELTSLSADSLKQIEDRI